MKIKKSLLFIMTLLVTLFYNCQSEAQEKQKFKPKKMASIQTKMQKKTIDLDENQRKQMKSINLKYAQKMQPLIQAIRASQNKEKFKNLRALNQEKNYEVAQVLSKDQYIKYLKLNKKMREKMRERRKQEVNSQ